MKLAKSCLNCTVTSCQAHKAIGEFVKVNVAILPKEKYLDYEEVYFKAQGRVCPQYVSEYSEYTDD